MGYAEVLEKHKASWNFEEVSFEEYFNAVDSLLKKVGFKPTSEQLDFLLTVNNKSVLLDATAGSGKTTTIIIKSLIDQKLWGLEDDSDILFLTFSKKSADDMLSKRTSILQRNFNGERNFARMSTIHSMCFALLSMYAKTYGLLHFFNENFIIQDDVYSISEIDKDSMVSESYNFSEMDDFDYEDVDFDFLEDTSDEFSRGSSASGLELLGKFIKGNDELKELDNFMEMRNILSIMSYQKETMLSDEEIIESRIFQDTKCEPHQYFYLREKYNREKEIFGYLDFTDMQLFTLRLLREFKDELKENASFNKLFNPKVIYVDEYQDLTKLQKELIKELVYFDKDGKKKLVCIGDSDQSIYEWRGADTMEYDNFQEMYKDTELMTFTVNHRCGANILNVANKLININKHRNPKTMIPVERLGEFEIRSYTNTKNQVHDLTKEILQIRDEYGEEELENVAVIYREHSQGMGLATSLLRNDILFNMGGSGKLPYNHWIFKNILDICQTILNADDSSRFSNLHRFTTLNTRMINSFKKEFEEHSKKNREYTWIDLLELRSKQGKPPYTDLKFINLYRKLRDALLNDQPVRPILESVYSLYQMHNLNYVLDKLIPVARTELEAIEMFIASIPSTEVYDTLYKNISNWDNQLGRSRRMQYGVKLMSIHATKGLEFNRVYLIGLDNKYLPKDAYAKELTDFNRETYIEEERRLLYVGITRAIQKCVIYASITEPSKFLPELDETYAKYLDKQITQRNKLPLSSDYEENKNKEDNFKYLPKYIKEGLLWVKDKI